jgi:hypothetical protein
MQTDARAVHHNLLDLLVCATVIFLVRGAVLCYSISQEAFDSLARTAHGLAEADAFVGAANPWKHGTSTTEAESKACVVS